MQRHVFAVLAASVLCPGALAQVTVSDAWVRATVPQATASGVFMRVTSARDARLIGVRSGAAGVVEVHRMEMKGQTMTMRAVPEVELPAGKTVEFSSGGLHVMLMALKHQLKAGDEVPLTLVVREKNRKPETVELAVPVKPLTYIAPVAAAPAR